MIELPVSVGSVFEDMLRGEVVMKSEGCSRMDETVGAGDGGSGILQGLAIINSLAPLEA